MPAASNCMIEYNVTVNTYEQCVQRKRIAEHNVIDHHSPVNTDSRNDRIIILN